MSTTQSRVRESQDPLRARYREAPEEAWVVDRAVTRTKEAGDPFHAEIEYGTAARANMDIGVHASVGGPHDLPVPGDVLCAALASCLDSTTRLIADRTGIPLARLEVEVKAHVDVRGTLAVDPTVPVGFQRLECIIDIDAGEATPRAVLERLVDAAERHCVVWQTLQAGIPVERRLAGTE